MIPQIPRNQGFSKAFTIWLEKVRIGDFFKVLLSQLQFSAVSTDPDDPIKNSSVIWQSNGLGTGGDGDIYCKITDSGGTTKTTLIVDFSII